MDLRLDVERESNITKIIHKKYGDDCLAIDTNIFYHFTDEILAIISHKIIEFIAIHKKTSICFDVSSEGFVYHILCGIDKTIRHLNNAYNIPYDFYYIEFGACEINANHELYMKHCSSMNWIPLKISFRNSFERGGSSFIKFNERHIHDLIDTTPRIKSKKFTCYIRSSKYHRLFLIGEIIERGLLSSSYTSCHLNDSKENFVHSAEWHDDFSYISSELPTLWERTNLILKNNINLFPISLGITDKNDSKTHCIHKEDLPHYNNAYFHIVAETKYFHDKPNTLENHFSLNCFFFTEKTFKCISGKGAFILAGFTGSLKALQELGYKTFHPFINESYDDLDDDEERLLAIITEVERLCNFSDDEWLIWQENIRPIVEHNYAVLKSRPA